MIDSARGIQPSGLGKKIDRECRTKSHSVTKHPNAVIATCFATTASAAKTRTKTIIAIPRTYILTIGGR